MQSSRALACTPGPGLEICKERGAHNPEHSTVTLGAFSRLPKATNSDIEIYRSLIEVDAAR